MIRLKTKQEIKIMRQGGKILARVIKAVAKEARPGASTKDLTELAEKLIKAAGGEPSFKGYKAAWTEQVYPAALCVSINNEVVHGLAVPERFLKAGDIIGLDCGLKYKNYFTDMAITVAVGRIDSLAQKLIAVTQEALALAIKQVKPGNHLSDIARAIEDFAVQNGFSVVRQLVGHGVGHSAHEEPQVPNYLSSDFKDYELKPGMALAIEPMINLGKSGVDFLTDGWTVVTADNSLSAHFEHTVAVTEKGCEVLTSF